MAEQNRQTSNDQGSKPEQPVYLHSLDEIKILPANLSLATVARIVTNLRKIIVNGNKIGWWPKETIIVQLARESTSRRLTSVDLEHLTEAENDDETLWPSDVLHFIFQLGQFFRQNQPGAALKQFPKTEERIKQAIGSLANETSGQIDEAYLLRQNWTTKVIPLFFEVDQLTRAALADEKTAEAATPVAAATAKVVAPAAGGGAGATPATKEKPPSKKAGETTVPAVTPEQIRQSVRYEYAWLYNRILYDYLTNLGIDPTSPQANQFRQSLEQEVLQFLAEQDHIELALTFANIQKRQALFDKFYKNHLTQGSLAIQLTDLYKQHLSQLDQAEKISFAKKIGLNEKIEATAEIKIPSPIAPNGQPNGELDKIVQQLFAQELDPHQLKAIETRLDVLLINYGDNQLAKSFGFTFDDQRTDFYNLIDHLSAAELANYLDPDHQIKQLLNPNPRLIAEVKRLIKRYGRRRLLELAAVASNAITLGARLPDDRSQALADGAVAALKPGLIGAFFDDKMEVEEVVAVLAQDQKYTDQAKKKWLQQLNGIAATFTPEQQLAILQAAGVKATDLKPDAEGKYPINAEQLLLVAPKLSKILKQVKLKQQEEQRKKTLTEAGADITVETTAVTETATTEATENVTEEGVTPTEAEVFFDAETAHLLHEAIVINRAYRRLLEIEAAQLVLVSGLQLVAADANAAEINYQQGLRAAGNDQTPAILGAAVTSPLAAAHALAESEQIQPPSQAGGLARQLRQMWGGPKRKNQLTNQTWQRSLQHLRQKATEKFAKKALLKAGAALTGVGTLATIASLLSNKQVRRAAAIAGGALMIPLMQALGTAGGWIGGAVGGAVGSLAGPAGAAAGFYGGALLGAKLQNGLFGSSAAAPSIGGSTTAGYAHPIGQTPFSQLAKKPLSTRTPLAHQAGAQQLSPAAQPAVLTQPAAASLTAGQAGLASSTIVSAGNAISAFGVLAPLTAIGFATFAALFTIFVIFAAFLAPMPTGNFSANNTSVSKYLVLEETATPKKLANNETAKVVYTINLIPRPGYKIQLKSLAANDEGKLIKAQFTTQRFNKNITTHLAQLQPPQPELDFSGLAAEFTQTQTLTYTTEISQGVNVIVPNSVEIKFDVYRAVSGQSVASDVSLKTEAAVVIGNPKVFCWPTTGKIVQLPNGSYTHARFHEDAFDILAAIGTTIHAPASGTAIRQRYNAGGYGNWVKLRLDAPYDGKILIFAHMSVSSLKVGESKTVSAGDVLGKVGSTGNSSAPHLHFELANSSLYGKAPLGENSTLAKLLNLSEAEVTNLLQTNVQTCW